MVLKNIIGRTPAWLSAVAMIAIGLAFGFGMKRLNLLDGPIGTAALVAVVIALGFIGSITYWRRLDEAAREAHKFAWYWGGSFGIGVSVVLATALTRGDLDAAAIGLAGGTQPGDFIGFGMLAAMGVQAVCYFFAWAGWWISKR